MKKARFEQLMNDYCDAGGRINDTTCKTLEFALQWCENNPTADNWISVEDRLPKELEWVLTCNGQESINLLMLAGNGNWYDKAVGLHYDITHWRPLPAPPIPE